MIYTNNNITADSILIFEYFTASGEKDKSIISEAESLIFSLVDDLKDYDVYWIIHESYKDIIDEKNNLTPIFIDGKLEDWLYVNSRLFTKSIFISAENNNNLFKFTKLLEDNGVKVYSSSSQAVEICSDKSKTFEHLYNLIPQPRTFKIKFDENGHWKGALENLYKNWQSENPFSTLKLILKPVNGVDCENIVIINSLEDINSDFEDIFEVNSDVLVQEYIEGEDVSVSLICDGQKAIPISLNKQFIQLDGQANYLGGELPYESKYKYEAFYIATRAVEAVEGIKGFVGVDLKINSDITDINDVYLLEINSRFTTPYVGLKKIAEFNIGQTIIDLLDNKIKIEEIDFSLKEDKISFKKENDTLEVF